MKRIAVILSGCGVQDGSEIHESVLTLLAIERTGARYQCFAPDILQQRVVNHVTGKELPDEARNVLVEAARIARGNIKPVSEAKVTDFDALIFPGGFGAATNLCDFASKGAACQIETTVLQFAQAMAAAKKPLGFICIAPVMIAKIYGAQVQMTIGNDPATAKVLTEMGNQHLECAVTECIIDKQHKVVSTPAYMLAQNISEAATGIEKLVHAVVGLT